MGYSAADIAGLKGRLDLYLEAEAAVLRNQSYELEGRKLVRANLAEIRKGIADLRAELGNATGIVRPRGRARRGVIL